MNDALSILSEADQERVAALAQQLSQYCLGIFAPHRHGDDGLIQPLPSNLISYEKDLKVSFVPSDRDLENAIAVGWQWKDGKLGVFARCCAA